MIEISNVKKVFKNKKVEVHALKDVSLKVEKGDIFGIVGYSGAGKSTLLRLVNLLEKPDDGSVKLEGKEIVGLSERELNKLRKNIGMVFQQFNLLETQTVYQNLKIPLIISKTLKSKIDERIDELLDFVGLKDKKNVSVSKLSGGQKQRIGIARALAVEPDFIVCDEPISSLDVSIQAQIINLLIRLQKEFRMTYLFIAHDLSIVKYISDKVGVMYSGKLVEFAKSADLYKNPLHPYSQALISAIPSTDIDSPMSARRIHIHGEISSAINPPQGCRFYKRCPKAFEKCKSIPPELIETEEGHFTACHLINPLL